MHNSSLCQKAYSLKERKKERKREKSFPSIAWCDTLKIAHREFLDFLLFLSFLNFLSFLLSFLLRKERRRCDESRPTSFSILLTHPLRLSIYAVTPSNFVHGIALSAKHFGVDFMVLPPPPPPPSDTPGNNSTTAMPVLRGKANSHPLFSRGDNRSWRLKDSRDASFLQLPRYEVLSTDD